jgi:hypothetical protein
MVQRVLTITIKLGTTRRSWKLKWAKYKIEARKMSISQHWAQQMGKDQNKVQVLERFTRYANVFSEEAAKRFPPERPEDHKIGARQYNQQHHVRVLSEHPPTAQATQYSKH